MSVVVVVVLLGAVLIAAAVYAAWPRCGASWTTSADAVNHIDGIERGPFVRYVCTKTRGHRGVHEDRTRGDFRAAWPHYRSDDAGGDPQP